MTENRPEDAFAALRDELAAVSPSPEFANRVRQRIAADLPLLREELAAVEPSAAFKARVRQRIDADVEARARSRWSDWRWLLPVATAAGIALVVAVMWRGAQSAPAPVTATNPPTPRRVETPAPVPQPAAARTAPPVAASPLRASNAGVHSAKGEPSMEVITNQPAILRALYARIAPDAAVVEVTSIPMPETAPEIVVPSLEVSPLVVKPLAEPPVIGSRSGGSSVIK
ncbi:MAG TPA: hypothetical protein VFV78_01265 [Vicinamibacterales bacterium]|nr:hypothetical protein [Vicinamibacterales bacterium]